MFCKECQNSLHEQDRQNGHSVCSVCRQLDREAADDGPDEGEVYEHMLAHPDLTYRAALAALRRE